MSSTTPVRVQVMCIVIVVTSPQGLSPFWPGRGWPALSRLEPAGVVGIAVTLGRPTATWRLPAPRDALAGTPGMADGEPVARAKFPWNASSPRSHGGQRDRRPFRPRPGASGVEVKGAGLNEVDAEAAPHQREDLAGHVLGLIAAPRAREHVTLLSVVHQLAGRRAVASLPLAGRGVSGPRTLTRADFRPDRAGARRCAADAHGSRWSSLVDEAAIAVVTAS